jgi:hypothetical protein
LEVYNALLWLFLSLVWINHSFEEAARYLETYKAFESKPPDMLMERVEKDYQSKLVDALTTAKAVNKTDVVMLSEAFGVRISSEDSH